VFFVNNPDLKAYARKQAYAEGLDTYAATYALVRDTIYRCCLDVKSGDWYSPAISDLSHCLTIISDSLSNPSAAWRIHHAIEYAVYTGQDENDRLALKLLGERAKEIAEQMSRKKEMLKDLATTLLADTFWNEWDNLYSSDRNPDDELPLIPWKQWDSIRTSYAGAGCEIVSGMVDLFESYGVELEPFLPIALTEKIVAAYDKAWGGRLTLAKLYEFDGGEDSRSAHRAVLGAVGHGVGISDDPAILEWVEGHGVDEPTLPYFDSPYNEAWDAVLAMQKAVTGED
jgi:hypothetical protein